MNIYSSLGQSVDLSLVPPTKLAAERALHFAQERQTLESLLVPGHASLAQHMAVSATDVAMRREEKFNDKLMDCHTRRKAAIMKAAQAIGQPYP